MKYRIVYTIILLALLIGNIAWAAAYLPLKRAYVEAEAKAQVVVTNTKVLAFFELLVSDLLMKKGDIDFESRLKLENTVRDIGDQELISIWKDFLGSADEQAAQAGVIKLLQKISSMLRA